MFINSSLGTKDSCKTDANNIIVDNTPKEKVNGTNVVENTPIATKTFVIIRSIFIVEHIDSVGM